MKTRSTKSEMLHSPMDSLRRTPDGGNNIKCSKPECSKTIVLVIFVLLPISTALSASPYWSPDLAGNDKFVNFRDFAVFAENWQKTGTGLAGDFDNSGKVDIYDLEYFAYYWLKEIDFKYAPGQIMVGFKPDVSQSTVEALAESLNCSIIRKMRKRNVYLWRVKGINNEQQVINQLQTNPDVLYAERNGLVYPSGQKIPNDPDFEVQWNLHQTSNADINAPEGWYEIYNKFNRIGNPDIVIAIVDTGVDYNHPDLTASMWTDSNGHHGYDFVNGDNYPMDDSGHGTHVAGIAAADTNNNTGIAGVSWGCSIMAVKVLPGLWSDVTDGIDYAVDNGANVVNMSLGSTASSSALENAINNAYDANVVLVAAAGNDSYDLDVNNFYPACFSKVICVSATDSDDQYCSFTNYGSFVDVAAPGEDIYSTLPNNSYGYKSGTSMAAPHVSALAALCLSMNSNYEPSDVKQCIIDAAKDLGTTGKDNYYGYGRIKIPYTCCAICGECADGFGTGTQSDPYRIRTFDDLCLMMSMGSSSYWRLCNNINAYNSRFLDGGAGWTPFDFSGNLNGCDFVISNLYINRPSTNHIGFIKDNYGGTITDLGLVDLNITGQEYVGGLIGHSYGCNIANCYSTGVVSGNFNLGGLVGRATGGGNITNCYSICTVAGDVGGSGIGGLVGYSVVNITNCYAMGDVSGVGVWVGGLVGRSDGVISNSYSTGNVSGAGYVGGFAGQVSAGITNCYSTGAVSGTRLNIGGFAGWENYGGPFFFNCYFLDTAGPDNGKGEPKTSSQLKQQATFEPEWNFETIWYITEGVIYPVLGSPVTLTVSSTVGGSVISPGEGVFGYPYDKYTPIIAEADEGYIFTYWSGTGVTAGKVTDAGAASTTILMSANYTVVANFGPVSP
ncbi:MAG: hypothetical protein A2173_10245 [Planctomycetes bacterium RBG_13_44_8b]|nr:MAG: hypothetical protein A2173_10245 [Planctomycetes bacterium RBG_13_44_8b]